MNYTTTTPSGARLTLCKPGNAQGAETESGAIRAKEAPLTILGMLLKNSRAHGYDSWQFEMKEKRHKENQESHLASLRRGTTQQRVSARPPATCPPGGRKRLRA